MSQTQFFPKLMRHLDKLRHLILLSQSYSRCLACQAKKLMIWKLQKAQQATLEENKLLLLKGSFTCALELTCLVSWPNEVLTYLQAPMELSGTFKGFLKIMNILEHPTHFYVQAHVQEYTRDLQNSLESLGLILYLPPQCRDVWTSLDIFRTFHTFPTNG